MHTATKAWKAAPKAPHFSEVTASEFATKNGSPKRIQSLKKKTEIQAAVTELRDFLGIDHLVYLHLQIWRQPVRRPLHSLDLSASWLARYLGMGYADVDPILREGFGRTLPFEWRELESCSGPLEADFLADAAKHGVGPHGYSIPVSTKHGHRGLFALSFSGPEAEWNEFLVASQPALIQIANRLAWPCCGGAFRRGPATPDAEGA